MVASTAKVLMNFHSKLDQAKIDQMISFIGSNIPMTGDPEENETALNCFIWLHSVSPDKLVPWMNNITLASLKIFVDPKCKEVN